MDNTLDVLVISGRPEHRKTFSRILDDSPVNSYFASNVQQAKEALASHRFAAVFCDENLSDGTYRDLLRSLNTALRKTWFAVMLCTGEWEEYLDALHSGAEEVLRCPLQPTDVDLAFIHAVRSCAGNSSSVPVLETADHS